MCLPVCEEKLHEVFLPRNPGGWRDSVPATHLGAFRLAVERRGSKMQKTTQNIVRDLMRRQKERGKQRFPEGGVWGPGLEGCDGVSGQKGEGNTLYNRVPTWCQKGAENFS